MSSAVLSTLEQLSYAGLFFLLLGGAIVIPIPEELTLLTAGYLIALGVLNPLLGGIVAIAGLMLGDVILFFLAKTGSAHAERFRKRINAIGLEKTWLFSPQQPLRAVVALRFLTGFRFIAPIYAGFEQLRWRSYLIANLIVLCLFVPGMLYLGYAFRASIVVFIASFEVVRHAVFIGILALAGVGMVPTVFRRVRSFFKPRA